MDAGKKRFHAIVAIGCCCLAAALFGCRSGQRHGCVLRGQWSLECNRTPWLTGGQTTCGEGAVGCDACGTECAEGAGSTSGGEAGPAIGPDGQPIACETVIASRPCKVCGARRGRVHGGRIRGGAAEAVEPVYYNHPRFHPVPIEPVFSPRTDLMPEAAFSQGDSLPATPSANAPPPTDEPSSADAPPSTDKPPSAEELPPINILPPTVAPEEIRVPQPERKKEPERVTDAPRRLTTTTSRPFDWLFRPSTSRGTLSTADVESTPKAGSVRR